MTIIFNDTKNLYIVLTVLTSNSAEMMKNRRTYCTFRQEQRYDFRVHHNIG